MYWRKIETAPRNGTIVLGAARVHDGDKAALIYWAGDSWQNEETDDRLDWEPTHFCRWESPMTVKEVEEVHTEETARIVTTAYYQQLMRELIRCCYWYYVKSQPISTDQEFDRRLKLLKEIEDSGRVKVDFQSPTQMIWGDQEDQYPEWVRLEKV